MNGKKRKHTCYGCRERKSRCIFIKQKCDRLSKNSIEFCFNCADFPCAPLKALDSRYRSTYGMSMVENLKLIKEKGMEWFLQKEQERWKCPTCGGLICVHNKKCYACTK